MASVGRSRRSRARVIGSVQAAAYFYEAFQGRARPIVRSASPFMPAPLIESVEYLWL